jgi:hypothetical protein
MEKPMIEKWKPVKGYEQYYKISNLGRVMRLDGEAFADYKRIVKEHELVCSRPKGMKFLMVLFYVKGKKDLRPLHRVVAENFLPNRKKLPYIHFIDGDTDNVSAHNLMWVDRSFPSKKYWEKRKSIA